MASACVTPAINPTFTPIRAKLRFTVTTFVSSWILLVKQYENSNAMNARNYTETVSHVLFVCEAIYLPPEARMRYEGSNKTYQRADAANQRHDTISIIVQWQYLYQMGIKSNLIWTNLF